jgi:hypothetical protein
MKNLFFEKFDYTIFPHEGEIEKSQHEVFTIARFKRNGEFFKVMTFPTDYNIFCTALEKVRARAAAFPKLFQTLSTNLVISVLEDSAETDELCRNILKTVCAFPLATRTQRRFQEQSFAFVYTIDVNNPSDSTLVGGTAADILEYLENEDDLQNSKNDENGKN